MSSSSATPTTSPKPAGKSASRGPARRWSWRTLGTSFRFWLCVLLAVVLVLVAYYIQADRYTPLTTDAFVQAYVVQVAPQVEGQVVKVHVREGDQVRRGELLFELDTRPFEHKQALLAAKLVETEYHVKQLEAQRSAAQAEHRQLLAEAEYARAVHRQEVEIYKRESTTERKYLDAVQKLKASEAAVERSASLVENVEQALAAKVGSEHASVAQVKAELAEAELNLSFAKVYAPCDGLVTNLQLREGAYAHVGQSVMTCIDTSQWLIVANFRERSLEHMQPGQTAVVALQAVPGKLWPAEVVSLGSGVSQGQGVPSGLLPSVVDQTAWIPAAQRFQVRLKLDEAQAPPALRVGMTGSASVYVDSSGPLVSLTRWVHKILSWLYYL